MIRPPCSTTNCTLRSPRRGGHEHGAVEVADLAQLGAAGARGWRSGVEVASAVAVAVAVAVGVRAAAPPWSPEPPQPSTSAQAAAAGDQRAALHAGCRTRAGAGTRPRWRNLAATTPPTAPNRWPCHDTPGVGTKPETSVAPYTAITASPPMMCQRGAGVGAAGDQVRGEPEHHAAGADVDRVVRRRGQPRAEAADDDHDHRDDRHALEAADRDRRAEDHERDRVADQVAPARRAGRARAARRPARPGRAAGSRPSRGRLRRRRRPRPATSPRPWPRSG